MAELKKRMVCSSCHFRKEAKVKEVLDAAIKNTNLGEYVSQVLIPTEKVYTTRNGKKVLKERNLYSGYVFVEANLTGEVMYELRNTTNVIDFLRGRSKTSPAGTSAGKRGDANAWARLMTCVFRRMTIAGIYSWGESVKVNFGPFTGFSGVIREVNADKKKIKGRGQDIWTPHRPGVGKFAGGTHLSEMMLRISAKWRITCIKQIKHNRTMAKEIAGQIKLQIKGGAANPSPPVGPALGSKGINIMEFCKQFNARTQDKAGKVLPVVITYYTDKSFDFVVKTPPVAVQLKEVAKLKERFGTA